MDNYFTFQAYEANCFALYVNDIVITANFHTFNIYIMGTSVGFIVNYVKMWLVLLITVGN